MTLRELSQFYHLNKEIDREQERLKQLEQLATGTTVGMSGMPHSGTISDKTAIAADIADCEAIIQARLQEAIVLRNRLERYIASIEDSLTRQIFTLRFVDGLPWEDVAAGIGINSDAVKKICYRYINNQA